LEEPHIEIMLISQYVFSIVNEYITLTITIGYIYDRRL
jgi:hypothetical protein